MKKWLNSINPMDIRVEVILFIVFIAFWVCFICFSIGMRPLWCFRTIEGNIVKLEDDAYLKTNSRRNTTRLSYASIKLDSSKERFINIRIEYAKLFDVDKPVKLWYYKSIFSNYRRFEQAEQNGKLLLKTYEVSGLVYLIVMVLSFIIGAACVYIRRDRKYPPKGQLKKP